MIFLFLTVRQVCGKIDTAKDGPEVIHSDEPAEVEIGRLEDRQLAELVW